MAKECTRNSHPLYYRWKSMRQRCDNPNLKNYHYYGGRGITYCEEWNDFYQFADDVGLPPTPQHQLDRIDNDGDYTPKNVRWVTPKGNTDNRGISKPYPHCRIENNNRQAVVIRKEYGSPMVYLGTLAKLQRDAISLRH